MSIFNEKQKEAMSGRGYTCPECGRLMEFEDEWEDVLVCPNCGHSVDIDRYGCENEEEYENLYPTREEVLGVLRAANGDEENSEGETYVEVCGELDN